MSVLLASSRLRQMSVVILFHKASRHNLSTQYLLFMLIRCPAIRYTHS